MDMLVLAGGFGTRLKNAVSALPKPMAPINGVPLLQLQLEHWVKQGQHSFVFLLHHQADIIIEFLLERSRYFGEKVTIDWIVEDAPMGTGGSVANAINVLELSGSVLVSNADTWLDGGLRQIINSDKPAVVGVIAVNDVRRYGSVSIDTDKYVVSFVEKQTHVLSKIPGIINAGVYKLPVNAFLGVGRLNFSLEEEILAGLSSKKALNAEYINGHFFDIGVPEDYYKFCNWHKLENDNG
jgi:D-glycero-alpha-D-manno-heptose 1-phosphate guanylyltransferase